MLIKMMRDSLTLLLLFISFLGIGQNPILIPPTLNGTNIDLTLMNGTYQFYNGINTTTFVINWEFSLFLNYHRNPTTMNK